jgi:hypothetical protein
MSGYIGLFLWFHIQLCFVVVGCSLSIRATKTDLRIVDHFSLFFFVFSVVYYVRSKVKLPP